MASQKFPIKVTGRMVWGDMYKGNPLDADGKQKKWKSGPDEGKDRATFDFGLAVRKTPGVTHFSQEPWGADIWKAGHAGVPNANELRDFSWKIKDGDDATVPPMKVGQTKPAKPLRERPGHAGCWILSLSSSFAPNLYNGLANLAPLTTPGAVQPGDMLQVKISAEYNGSSSKPGVYLNHEMVVFSGQHPEGRIATGGQDPHAEGFTLGLVEGAVDVPGGSTAAPAPAATMPPPPGTPAAAGAMPPPPPAAAPAAPPPATAVTPNAAYGAPPPPVAPAAPAAPARVMLPAAGGVSYQSFKDNGWTDEQLIQNGKMAP